MRLGRGCFLVMEKIVRLTYCISGGEFLFRRDDGAGALGFVQGAFASNDGFSLPAAAAGFAADFGYRFPVVHG